MAVDGDRINIKVVSELAGVQMSNTFKYELTAINGGDSISQVLDDLMTTYWDAVDAVMGQDCKFSCAIWDNQDRNEKATIFPNRAGVAAGGAHPPFVFLQFNLWGREVGPPSKIRRNNIKVGGIAENQSVDGRVAETNNFNAWTNWLILAKDTGPTGMQFQPVVEWVSDPGPPVVKANTQVEQVKFNSQFLTLQTRKSSLCSA